MFETGRRIVRRMTIHLEAWPAFVAQIPAIKAANLEGDALWDRIELAWAPLFEGVGENDGALIFEDAMYRLAHDGVIPRSWLPGH